MPDFTRYSCPTLKFAVAKKIYVSHILNVTLENFSNPSRSRHPSCSSNVAKVGFLRGQSSHVFFFVSTSFVRDCLSKMHVVLNSRAQETLVLLQLRKAIQQMLHLHLTCPEDPSVQAPRQLSRFQNSQRVSKTFELAPSQPVSHTFHLTTHDASTLFAKCASFSLRT